MLSEGILEHFRIKVKIRRYQRHIYRFGAGQNGICTVVFIERREYYDLIARISNRKHGRHHRFGTPACYGYLGIGIDVHSHEAALLFGKCPAESRISESY